MFDLLIFYSFTHDILLHFQDIKRIKEHSQGIENRTWLMEWRARLAGTGPMQFWPAAVQQITALVLECLKGFNPGDVELDLSYLALHQAVQASDDVDYDSEVDLRARRHRDIKKGLLLKLCTFFTSKTNPVYILVLMTIQDR